MLTLSFEIKKSDLKTTTLNTIYDDVNKEIQAESIKIIILVNIFVLKQNIMNNILDQIKVLERYLRYNTINWIFVLNSVNVQLFTRGYAR